MITGTSLMSYFFDGDFQIKAFHIRLVRWLIFGFLFALLGWFINEINYQDPLKANSDAGPGKINHAVNDEA
jgi:hypothetical protein